MHLDKSHICAHTYPDFRHKGTVCSFRIDIEISTCGEISPLKALNYMFEAFDFDVAVIDYKVRGYTRDGQDRRIYLDHEMSAISDHIHEDILADYYCEDFALKAANIWQIKMLKTNLDRQSYFLNPVSFDDEESRGYLDRVKQEMRGLLYMSSD